MPRVRYGRNTIKVKFGEANECRIRERHGFSMYGVTPSPWRHNWVFFHTSGYNNGVLLGPTADYNHICDAPRLSVKQYPSQFLRMWVQVTPDYSKTIFSKRDFIGHIEFEFDVVTINARSNGGWNCHCYFNRYPHLQNQYGSCEQLWNYWKNTGKTSNHNPTCDNDNNPEGQFGTLFTGMVPSGAVDSDTLSITKDDAGTSDIDESILDPSQCLQRTMWTTKRSLEQQPNWPREGSLCKYLVYYL